MPGDESLQSIQRAVQILYAVAGVEDGCSIQQIATKTGLKPNTAYKITRTLEREHLLLRKKGPLRFILGQTLAELRTLDDERHLLTLAGKLLVRTQARFPASTFSLFEIQQAITYQRLCVQSNRPGIVVQRREFIVPLYDKASSLLFLAYSPPSEIQKFYSTHPFEKAGRSLWKTKTQLEAFLAKVRRLGYCQPDVPDSEFPNFRVAAPVFSKGQELIACIGAYVLAEEPKSSRPLLVKLCRQAARDLTLQLKDRGENE